MLNNMEQALHNDQLIVASGPGAIRSASTMAGDVPDHDSTASELYESSNDVRSTSSGATVQIRPDLHHWLNNFDFGFGSAQQPPLTEHAIAALDTSNARGYQHDIHDWISGHGTTSAAFLGQENAALVSELSQSMIVTERSTTSSHGDTMGSSWCLVTDEAARLNTTDQHVYAAGVQFDNEAASPFSIDEILM
ncbi:hypothetical protein MN608_04948 [Microdochium nivale]|nr:hypothetical protein MN608_04948 [Microdochium nivale]